MAVNKRWHFYAPCIVEVSLLLVSGWFVYSMWWQEVKSEKTPAPLVAKNSVVNTYINPKKLSEVALFGKREPVIETKKPVAAKSIANSRLDIKLFGTVAAGERSAAIMTVGRSAETPFFIGDPLQDGVFLKTVEGDTVVLDNRGKDERISLSERKLKGEGSIAMMAPSMTIPPMPVPSMMHPATIAPPMPEGMQQAPMQFNRSNALPALMSQAMMIPHMEQGKITGFTIQGIVPGSVYMQIGLREGDIIRSVGGQPVGNQDPAMMMYQSVQKSSAIALDVMRGGALIPIHYVMR